MGQSDPSRIATAFNRKNALQSETFQEPNVDTLFTFNCVSSSVLVRRTRICKRILHAVFFFFFLPYLEHLLPVMQNFRAEAVRKAKHQTDYS